MTTFEDVRIVRDDGEGKKRWRESGKDGNGLPQ